MSLQLLFWVLYLVALIFSLYQGRSNFPAWAGGSLVQFILIGILGWGVFGQPVRG